MNVLLIYPKAPDNFWNGKKLIKRYLPKQKSALPPLGLLTIASMLPKNWNLKLIDLNVKKLIDQDLKSADMVFISAMIAQKENTTEIINRCKSFGKIIVAGGPLFVEYEKFPMIDHIFLGETENTIPLFLEDLSKGKVPHIYKSITYPDLTKNVVIPKWDLINFKDYVTLTVQFSRGCPYNCDFCDITAVFGKKVRTKTMEFFLQELNILREFGWKGNIFIADDNFIGHIKNAKELLKGLISWQKKYNYPFRFLTQVSINVAKDDSLLKLLREAHFYKVFIGIETPNDVSLEACGKNQNVQIDIASAVKKVRAYGIDVMAGFVVGFNTDTKEIFKLQEKFIKDLNVVKTMILTLMAPPGTKLRKMLEDAGTKILETGANYGINFEPKMGMKTLLTGYKRLKKNVFKRRNYYRRVKNSLKENTYIPKWKKKTTFADIVIFLKTVWYIGIFSFDCIYYWRLLFYTIFVLKKPELVSTFLEMAIERPYLKRN